MNLISDVFLQPTVVVLWSVWMFGAVVMAPIVLQLYGAKRLDRIVVTGAAIAVIVLMPLWHAQMGYTRLLGFPHIVIWTPLLIYLYLRRKHFASPWQVRWVIAALLATIVVSLGFDYTDTLRYILGERAPLV